jgi:hypothetical protein
MDLLNYYQSLVTNESERDIICKLLDSNPAQFKLGQESFIKIISKHVGDKDLIRLLKDLLPTIISSNGFLFDNGEVLSPKEALEMLDSVLYLEILNEEFLKKSGRRGFFISTYKAVNTDWVYLAYEFLLAKSQDIKANNLLALSIGLKKYDLNIISQWNKTDRIKAIINLTRKKQIGVFEDGSFIGFTNYKRINDVEDMLQIIFTEINLLTGYFLKKEGFYFEVFGNIQGILALPTKEIPKIQSLPKKAMSQIEKSLLLLKLDKLPSTKQELKKAFGRLAMETHPDKFASQDKGTRTEIAIVEKFRELYSAYEILEKEIKIELLKQSI